MANDELYYHEHRDFGDEHIPRHERGSHFDDLHYYEDPPNPPEAIPFIPTPEPEIQQLADIAGLEEELLYTEELDQRAVLFHRVEKARVATWAFMQERNFEPHVLEFQTELPGSHDKHKVVLNKDFLRGMGHISLGLYRDLCEHGDIGKDMADDIIQEVKTQYDPEQKLIY